MVWEDTSVKPRDPVVTRQKSAEQKRRNSVSDITDFFEGKTVNMPPTPNPARKPSGKKDKEKEKEREKELNRARESIKNFIANDGKDKSNANGDHTMTGEQHVEQSESTQPENSLNHEKACTSRATQTTEDEMLKAIKELADKYQRIDNDVNDPKVGISIQLAKTQDKLSSLHTDIHGAVSGIETRLQQITTTANANSQKIVQMEGSQTRMAALLDENKRIIKELKIMQGLVQKCTQKMDHQNMQILESTKRSMEQNLLIHGVDDFLEINDPKEKEPKFKFKERPKYSALEFFKKEMNLDLNIEDVWKAHRTGAFKPDKVRPLIVKLSYAAKDLIMENIGILKGRSNPNTKQTYFISEQVPEGILEMRKQTADQAQKLKDMEEKKPKEERNKVQIVNNKVLLGGELQFQEVETPSPSQLFVDLETEEIGAD